MPNEDAAVTTEDEKLHDMEKRQRPPYWFPDMQSILQLFLAVSIVIMVWYILKQLLSGEALKIDPSVRDLIVFIFGIVFGNFKDVYSFTFGSSAADKQKGDVINRSIESKDKIIAAGVATAAASTEAALTAASAVAPLAAEAAAPVAAERAAPPAAEKAALAAAEKAVADALAKTDEPKDQK